MDLTAYTLAINNARIKDENISANSTGIQTQADGQFNINLRPKNGFDGSIIILRKTKDQDGNAKWSLIRRIISTELADNEAIWGTAAGTIGLCIAIETGTLTVGDIDVDVYNKSYVAG